MGLIVLEAALALGVLIFLIWWTMFSGRRDGELHEELRDATPGEASWPGPAPAEPAQPAERGGSRNDIG